MFWRCLCGLGSGWLLLGQIIAPQVAWAEMVSAKDLMVPMRDGVQLATDVYFPGGADAGDNTRFPTILLRTPYDKSVRAESAVKIFVAHGYAVVVQDVRGRYHSEGHWFPLRDDPQDG